MNDLKVNSLIFTP